VYYEGDEKLEVLEPVMAVASEPRQ
jgi:hypothetical protein